MSFNACDSLARQRCLGEKFAHPLAFNARCIGFGRFDDNSPFQARAIARIFGEERRSTQNENQACKAKRAHRSNETQAQRLVRPLHDFLKPLPRCAPYTLWMIDVHPSSEPPKPSVRMTILFSKGL